MDVLTFRLDLVKPSGRTFLNRNRFFFPTYFYEFHLFCTSAVKLSQIAKKSQTLDLARAGFIGKLSVLNKEAVIVEIDFPTFNCWIPWVNKSASLIG